MNIGTQKASDLRPFYSPFTSSEALSHVVLGREVVPGSLDLWELNNVKKACGGGAENPRCGCSTSPCPFLRKVGEKKGEDIFQVSFPFLVLFSLR